MTIGQISIVRHTHLQHNQLPEPLDPQYPLYKPGDYIHGHSLLQLYLQTHTTHPKPLQLTNTTATAGQP
jgi:hypothetical protein